MFVYLLGFSFKVELGFLEFDFITQIGISQKDAKLEVAFKREPVGVCDAILYSEFSLIKARIKGD